MTVLSVIKDVVQVVGVADTTSVFSNIAGNRPMQEMLALANEMAQRIAYNTREWTRLRASQIYDGDGTTTAWDLPANYKRMLLTSNIWRSTSVQQPMRFFSDADEWLKRRLLGHVDAWGEWTIMDNQVQIFPAMGVGVSAAFAYLDKNCVTFASGGVGDHFMADGDSFSLDERLLKLGMIWQWKAHKGSPYAEDMGTYGDALTYAMGADKPSPIIAGGVLLRGWGWPNAVLV